MNIKRGMLRLWGVVSLLWIVLIGGIFAVNEPDQGYQEWILPILGLALLPPFGLLVLGAIVAWVARGFRS